MDTYFVLKNKDETFPILTKNGFSLAPLIGGILWGITKGIWEATFFNLLIFVILYLNSETLGFISLALSNIYWGFFGNDLFIQKLIKLKFLPEEVVTAPSSKKALIIYLSKNS